MQFEQNMSSIAYGAILFTDVRGSTNLWNTIPDQMQYWLHEHEMYVTRMVKLAKKSRAFVVKMIGDAFMIAFLVDSEAHIEHAMADAVQFAAKIQQDLEKRSLWRYENEQFRIRIGISAGALQTRHLTIQDCAQQDFFGPVCNAASRMESKASPVGGIAINMLMQINPENIKTYTPAKSELNLLQRLFSLHLEQFAYRCTKKDNASQFIHISTNKKCRSARELKGVNETWALVAAPNEQT